MIKKISLILVAFFVCGVLNAQNIEVMTTSLQVEFPFLGGDQVITRNYKNTHFVTHFRNYNDTLTHSFTIYKKPGGPVARVSTTFPIELPNHTTYCNVNDMQIYGDYCYYCGKMKILE